jgi:steroid delta-isomerase
MSKARTVERYISALNVQNLDGIIALYAEDATVEDPIGTPIIEGKVAIREFYSKATSIKLSARLLGDVRVAGDFVTFPFAITLPSEAGQMRIEVIDTFKINEQGLITEMKAFWGEDNCHVI